MSKDSDSTIDICTTNRFSIGEMNNCATYTLHEAKDKCQEFLTEMKEIGTERKTSDYLKFADQRLPFRTFILTNLQSKVSYYLYTSVIKSISGS